MGISRFLNSGCGVYMHKHKNGILQKPDQNRDTKEHVNMVNDTLLRLLFLFWTFSMAGLPAVIQTQQTVMAAVGDKVSLKCQLMETKDVLQVTWQKFSPRGDYNVATSNKIFGQTVNPDFKDKVEFEDAGLQSSSIVINNVTEQDEGCYHCLFNSFPDGALTGRTCLQVYELHQPVLHVRGSNSTEELVVSCSATGRPAPTVTLRATPQDHNLTHYNSVSVSNTNGTVTVTTTAVLSALHLNSTQVGCTVGVLSGPQIEVLETIPGLKPTSADDLDDEVNVHVVSRGHLFIIVSVLLTIGLAAVIIVRLRRETPNREPQRDERPENTWKAESPSVTNENTGLRNRTPPENSTSSSPSTPSRFDLDDSMMDDSRSSDQSISDESGNEPTVTPSQFVSLTSP